MADDMLFRVAFAFPDYDKDRLATNGIMVKKGKKVYHKVTM